MAKANMRLMRGTCELFEVLEDIRVQLEQEKRDRFKIISYADAQRELVTRIRTTGIHKRRPKTGEILLY